MERPIALGAGWQAHILAVSDDSARFCVALRAVPGPPRGSSRQDSLTPLGVDLIDMGVRVPETQGKVERLFGTLKREMLCRLEEGFADRPGLQEALDGFRRA